MRIKKHPEYYAIKAYQILSRKTDEDMAKSLGITERTYKEKIAGWYDFTLVEAEVICSILDRTKDEIFLTENVTIEPHLDSA